MIPAILPHVGPMQCAKMVNVRVYPSTKEILIPAVGRNVC